MKYCTYCTFSQLQQVRSKDIQRTILHYQLCCFVHRKRNLLGASNQFFEYVHCIPTNSSKTPWAEYTQTDRQTDRNRV